MSTSPDAPDFRLAMEAVAIALMGEPAQRLKSGRELRWRNRGSMSVDLTKGVWHDKERNVGGGTLALVIDQLPTDKLGALDYMRKHGHLPDRERPKPNGSNGAHHATPAPKPRQVAYDYTDADGVLLFQVVRRFDPKKFLQRQPDQAGGWAWNLAGVQTVPYRLPELLAAVAAGRTIYVCEGEKDVDALRELGAAATCNPGGASKWKREHSAPLDGANVVILPDADEPGRAHGQAVMAALGGIAATVQVIQLPNLPDKGDVSDWIAAGGTLAALEALEAPDAPEQPQPAPEAKDAPPPSRMPLLWLDDIKPVLTAQDFVQGVLVRGSAVVIYGKSNAGKTFWTTDLALHVAAGKQWNGRRVDQGGVVYCALEGGNGFRNRAAAWRNSYPGAEGPSA